MTTTIPAGGAPLDTPAPPAATFGSFHVDVGAGPRSPLFCRAGAHDALSVRICDSDVNVWLTGTPDELHAFASTLQRLVNDAVRELIVVPSPDVEQLPRT